MRQRKCTRKAEKSECYARFGPIAAAVLVCSLVVSAAPPGTPLESQMLSNAGALIESGQKVPAYRIPRAETVEAMRADSVISADGHRLLLSVAGDEGAGSVATPSTGGPTGCQADSDCDDCNPCTGDTCVSESCVHGNLDLCEPCDDGLECNGTEVCDGSGGCLPGSAVKIPPPDPCEGDADGVCDETPLPHISTSPGCVTACQTDAECEDNNPCTGTETCTSKRCIGGADDGEGCVDGTTCDLGLCGGVCRATGNPCGSGAPCLVSGMTFTCGWGRCCEAIGGGEFDCTRAKLADCTGRWLGVGDSASTLNTDDATCTTIWGSSDPNPGEAFNCPKYESGIVDGNIVASLGPSGNASCHLYSEVGDDYQLSNFDPGDFIELRTFRWIGGYDQGTGSRMRIRFYDTSNRLVADTITGPSFNAGLRLRTVTFGEGEAVIPAQGYVTVGPAVQFNADNRSRWGVTDAVGFIGTNNAANVVIRVGNGPLTVTSAAGEGLPNGVLAFEIVGTKLVGQPLGACCIPETGVCSQQLKHVCDELEGSFQGVGTLCNVCLDNPFLQCETNQDCIDGGALGPCVPAPPSCLLNACCDPDTGECGLSDTGGTCSVSLVACFNDSDCVGGGGDECIPNCPGRCAIGNFNEGEFCNANNECDLVSENDGLGSCAAAPGLVPQGFGTACEPNCCISPTLANKDLSGPFPDSGTPGDTCLEADANKLVINVPPPGDVAIYTISGNNKNATFGDQNDGSCNAGFLGADRGYWVAFSIDACADVRVDMCCTGELSGEVHQPQWAFMYTDCNPCTSTVGNSIVGSLTVPPIGTNDAANDRGAPFCNLDDLWQTFRALQPGTYYHPIYTSAGGHFGQFQVHIAVTACPLAACCIPGDADNAGACSGGPTPGALCNQDSDCGGGGTCKQGCQLLNQVECGALNGYWHGFGNVPTDQSPVVTCGTPYLCVSGTCNNGPNQGQACVNDSDCGPPNICDFGSCCLPGGVCDDSPAVECDPSNPASCYDLDLCSISNGTYRGGARCDYPLNPCPACLVESEASCQLPDIFTDFGLANMSDLSQLPHGVAVADDFIPAANSIGSVCVWGVYLDPTVENTGCAGVVADKFRVRIYADDDIDNDPTTSNMPGALIGQRVVTGNAVSRTRILNTAIQQQFGADNLYEVHGYTLDLGAAIGLPAAGEVYWLEVANDTSHLAGADPNVIEEATVNRCEWHWLQSWHVDGVGNNYSHTGTDDRPANQAACRGGTAVGLPCDDNADCVGGGTCVNGGNGYYGDGRSGRAADMTFCLGNANGPVPMTAPAEPLGVCCLCDGSFQLGRTLDDCREGNGDGDVALNGTWHASNDSAECVQQLGDNCGAAASGSAAAGLDCTGEPPPPGGAVEIGDGLVAYDSSCALNSVAPELNSGNFLVEDVWLEYTATCTGRLVISSCASGNYYGGFDSYLAVYHSNVNPTACPCPNTNAAIVADEDESCNGVADGGAGHAPPFIVVPGDCYLIRAGGWNSSAQSSDSSHGGAMVDVQCFEAACTPSAAPVQERLVVGLNDFANQKVRHLAVHTDVADAGKNQALRVTVIDLPAGHEANEGAVMYVGTPRRVCENAGQANLPAPGSPPNFGCGPAGGGPRTTWIASLQTDPVYMDWHGVCTAGVCVGGLKPGEVCAVNADCAGAVNAYHSVIAPSRFAASPATFEVSAVADDCLLTDATSFSDPLVMTAAKWGDVLQDNSTMPPRPSNNITEISDVVGILNKFKNLAGAVAKARADIEPACVDHLVQISDVTNALDAFASDPFPFPPGNPNSGCP